MKIRKFKLNRNYHTITLNSLKKRIKLNKRYKVKSKIAKIFHWNNDKKIRLNKKDQILQLLNFATNEQPYPGLNS